MRSSDIKASNEYIYASQKLSCCFAALSVEYVLSRKKPIPLQNTFFVVGIAKILSQYYEIFNYLNQLYKTDFADVLKTHTNRYVEILNTEDNFTDTCTIFQKDIENIIDHLNNARLKHKEKLSEGELSILQNEVADIIQKCKILFGDQSHTTEMIDDLQGKAIVFGIGNFSTSQQQELLAKLLLVKELWRFDHQNNIVEEENFCLEFFANPIRFLRDLETSDVDATFHNILTFLTNDHKLLQYLSDTKLITLYDRLKDIEINDSSINDLLHKIHQESSLRYNYSRLSESGYELLKKFQSYDAIFYQIDNAEFRIVEAFLLKNVDFMQEILAIFMKHVDNIRAIGCSKLPILHAVLNKLKAEILRHDPSDINSKRNIEEIKTKLSLGPDTQIINRYSELNKFTISVLKNKYTILFENIRRLLDNDEKNDQNFLLQTIVKKFAQDYYIPNSANSVNSLRMVANDRMELIKQLSIIDFVDIFNSEHVNKITTLNFKKQVIVQGVKNITDYIEILIKMIVSQCSASQLNSLYKPLLQGDLTKAQQILKREVSKQIKQRTTVTKLIYSVFTGKKGEYDKLKIIKDSLSVRSKKNINKTQRDYQSEVVDFHSNINSELKSNVVLKDKLQQDIKNNIEEKI